VRVAATYSIKGGVGKTTAAVNLSFEAARSGARVLLWDLDPQGAATFFFRVKPGFEGGAERLLGKHGELATHVKESDLPGLHLVPADFSLRHLDLRLDEVNRSTRRLAALLDPLAERYDVAMLDCPPGITLTSEAVFRTADALLVPTIPTTLSIRTLTQLAGFLATTEAPPAILPFVSMFDRRKALHRELVGRLAHSEPRFLRAAVPNASTVERMGTQRAPLGEFAPHTAAATAFHDLWNEVAGHLWPTNNPTAHT
jgi:cellulose biosynthesis protein BcsQ